MAKMSKAEIAAYNLDLKRLQSAQDDVDKAKREWERLKEVERVMSEAFDAKWNPDLQKTAAEG